MGMSGTDREACGRCAMTSVTDASAAGKSDDEQAAADPFSGSRIELSETELRSVSPSAWFAGAKHKIDEIATRLIDGR